MNMVSAKPGFFVQDRFLYSKDNEKVILVANPEYIYRHSFVADYYLYNIKDKTIKKLSDNKS